MYASRFILGPTTLYIKTNDVTVYKDRLMFDNKTSCTWILNDEQKWVDQLVQTVKWLKQWFEVDNKLK